ncbi:MAG: hypothetical protein J6S73_06860 [Lentisphaeria bacterium]|nr:hypothetical protein [Lentisphaeria bacterium]
MKKLLFGVFALCSAVLFAESLVLTPENCVIKPYKNSGTAEYKDGAWIISGPVQILSKEKIAVDETKKYRLSGTVKAVDGTEPATLCIGFAPQTAQGQVIAGMHLLKVDKSYGTLVEAVKPGDTVLKVRPDAEDGAAWSKPVTGCHVALDAKKDLSDLPNFRLGINVRKSEVVDGVQVLTLAYKLSYAMPAGTMVRLHRGGGDSMHSAFRGKKYTDQPMFFAGTVTGRTMGWNYNVWPVNAADCRVQVLANWVAPASKVEVRDLKLDILP